MSHLFRLFTFTLAAILLHLHSSCGDNVHEVDDNQKVIFCYWGTWSHYRPGNGSFQVSNIDPNLCTHLGYTFFGIADDGAIKSLDTWLDNDLGNIRKAIELKKRNPQLKVLASVGGWNEGSAKYSAMAADGAKRGRFISSVVQFLLQHQFDGIDLDWEYPARRGGQAADRINYITLLRELKGALSPHNLLLTTAVAATEAAAQISYDIRNMAQYVDLINVMSYDYFGSWDPVLGFNSPLDGPGPNTVKASIAYWLKEGAPANKLLLGVPLYGRTFTLADKSRTNPGDPSAGPGTAGPYTGTAGFLGYNEICEKFRAGGWAQKWDATRVVPFAHKDNQWISYDDKRSIEQKISFLKSANLRGAITWSIETDDFHGLCGEPFTLLKAVRNAIHAEDAPQGPKTTTIRPIDRLPITGPPVTSAPAINKNGTINNEEELIFVLLDNI